MTFADKVERRKQRYTELAAKNSAVANRLWDSPSRQAVRDMQGEPIKVGHHSERRHRRLIEKAFNDAGKAVAAMDKAQYYADKVESIENSKTIYSDDENAVAKLEEKLAKLEAQQAKMKDINAQYRKSKGDVEKMACSDTVKEAIRQAAANWKYSWPFVPYETWQLSNNNATIKNTRQRLEKLKKAAADTTTETVVNGIKVLDNVEENRVQILFPGKPSEEIRIDLKRNGFRWSPTNKAWQRHRSDHALYVAKQIISKL